MGKIERRDFREIDWKQVFVVADSDTHELLKITAQYLGMRRSAVVRTILKAWLRECWGTLEAAKGITDRIARIPAEETKLRKTVRQHFHKLTVEGGTGLFK
jgi:hypothetical protein